MIRYPSWSESSRHVFLWGRSENYFFLGRSAFAALMNRLRSKRGLPPVFRMKRIASAVALRRFGRVEFVEARLSKLFKVLSRQHRLFLCLLEVYAEGVFGSWP